MNLVRRFLNLVSEAAKGNGDLTQSAIGVNGYGFLFRNEDSLPEDITYCGGGKIFSLGSMKEFAIDCEQDKVEDFKDYLGEDRNYVDIFLIGALKTLIPDLRFGHPNLQDTMFDAWALVKTPGGRIFPINIYYGPTCLAFGDWNFQRSNSSTQTPYGIWNCKKESPSNLLLEFEDIVNFRPKSLIYEERHELAEALELALMRVPPSDFIGLILLDFGYRLRGLIGGKPYLKELPYKTDLDFALSLQDYKFNEGSIIKVSKEVDQELHHKRNSDNFEEIEPVDEDDIDKISLENGL